MSSSTNYTPHTDVTVDVHGHGSTCAKSPESRRRQHNFNPVPLRLPFLSICIALFASCIVSIEILLRNADVPPEPPTSTATNMASTAVRPVPISLPVRQRQKRLPDYCKDASTVSSRMVANVQSSNSLCAEFTTSYEAHTANMSYPVQTAVSQWLMKFNAVTSEYRDLSRTSMECITDTVVYSSWASVIVDVGCATSVTALKAPCTGFGTMYITGFQLTSGILPVCGVTTSRLLEQTTQPRSGTSAVPTESLLVPAVPSQSTLNPSVASSNAPTTQPGMPDSTRKSTPASDMASVSNLPTVTLSQARQSSSSPSPVPSNPTNQDTTFLAFQTEQSTTVVNQEVGTETTSKEDHNGAATTSTMSITQVVTGSSVVVPQVIATSSMNPKTVITEVVNGKTVVTDIQANSPGSKTAVTAIISGQTVVTEVQAASSPPAPDQTTLTATVVNGQTLVTEAPTTAPVPSQAVVTTVINSGTRVTGVYKTVVTAVVSGKTIVTDLINTGSARSSTLITAVISGQAIVTTVGLCNTTPTTSTASALPDPATSIYTTTTQYVSVIRTTGTDGEATSFSAVVVQTMITTSTGNGTRTVTQTSPTRPSQPKLSLSSSEKVVKGTFTTASYFAAQYLPSLVAVVIKAMWEMVFAAIKLVQPFERMNHAGGATAKYSVFAQYLSTSLSLDVLRSSGHGNFMPVAAASALVLVQIGTPLAAAAMSVRSSDICIIDDLERRCAPLWIVNKHMLRSVQASLGACMVLAVVLAVSLRRARSGVSFDPSSFGALATMMNHEQLLQILQRLPPDIDNDTFEEVLDEHLFWVGYHKTSEGTSSYGIMASKEEGTASRSSFHRCDEYDYHAVTDSGLEAVNPEIECNSDANKFSQHSTHSTSYTHTTIITRIRNALITDVLGLLSITTLLALILAFYLDTQDDVFNSFFNSGTVWPKLLTVGLATIVSLQMSHIERVVRITEPFRRLAANAQYATNTPNETTLLISRSGTPYSNLFQCVSLLASHELHGGRMTFQTLVALTAVFSDLNIIAVSGVVFSDAQTLAVYQGSSISSIVLTSIIFLLWLVILFWWRNNKTVNIVRAMKGAGTVGGMMRYLGGGGKDIVGEIARIMEEWEMRGLTGRVEGTVDNELKPCFGRFVGSDGGERWCVGFLKVEDEKEQQIFSERRGSEHV